MKIHLIFNLQTEKRWTKFDNVIRTRPSINRALSLSYIMSCTIETFNLFVFDLLRCGHNGQIPSKLP